MLEVCDNSNRCLADKDELGSVQYRKECLPVMIPCSRPEVSHCDVIAIGLHTYQMCIRNDMNFNSVYTMYVYALSYVRTL
jgi:hypothetical protein